MEVIAPSMTYPRNTADAEKQIADSLRRLEGLQKDSAGYRRVREHTGRCVVRWNNIVRSIVSQKIPDEDAKEADRLDFAGAAQLIETITESEAEWLFKWGLLQQHDDPRPVSKIAAQFLKDRVEHENSEDLDDWTAWWRGLLDVEPWTVKVKPGLEL